jgi:hypothetical protein
MLWCLLQFPHKNYVLVRFYVHMLSHYVSSSVLWCPLRFPHKNDARLYFLLFVGVVMSYLRYLCLLTYSGVQHILTMWVWVSWRMSCGMKKLLALCMRLWYALVFGRYVLLIFFAFCVVLFLALFVFVYFQNKQ